MVGSSGKDRTALAAAFAHAAGHYWLSVFPCVRSEARHWRRRAEEIPDPTLRRLALITQRAERGNLEGAAAFAVLVPRGQRSSVVRALVAFQAIYDYVDTLAEQPSADPMSDGHQLHQALLIALDTDSKHVDYYSYHPRGEDAGYLRDLVDACRSAFGTLPSYASLAAPALRATKRMVDYQSLNHGGSEDSQHALARWASTQIPLSVGLRWWEIAAGAASSLVVFALITAAAQPTVHASDTIAMEAAYFPWIGALHVLLDSLIDLPEDIDAGQHSLVDHYASPEEIASRLQAISAQAVQSIEALPSSTQHGIILAAMTSFYLSDRQASSANARLAREEILATMGDLAAPTMLILGARRKASRLAHSLAPRGS
jgi:tetraprenyl-beta-curcumene synthase